MGDEIVKNGLQERAYQFALQIVKLVRSLPREESVRIIGSQLLRSATSIGANLEEAYAGLTRKDFVHSYNIARKEARETRYWLRLLSDSGILPKEKLTKLLQESEELIKILTSVVKKYQERQQ